MSNRKWRCEYCRAVNSAERNSCTQCGAPIPDSEFEPPEIVYGLIQRDIQRNLEQDLLNAVKRLGDDRAYYTSMLPL